LKQTLAALVIIIIIFTLNSCSDDPSSIGSDLVRSDYIKVANFDSQVDSLSQSSSFFKKVLPLGLASKILLGRRGDTEASILMKFVFSIDDSMKDDLMADNIVIKKAYLELTPAYTFSDTLAPLDFSVHKINDYWSITQFTADSLQFLSYENEDLSSNKNFNDTLYTLDLDNSLILSWIKSSIDTSLEKNLGIFFKPDINSAKIVGFESLTTTSTDAAKLRIVIEKQGSYTDTIRGYIFGDVSAVSTELPILPAGEMGVQASSTLQSKILLDTSILPKNIIINRAELLIQEDTLNSVIGTAFGSALQGYLITDSDSNIVDENSRVSFTKSDNIYTGDITDLIDYWYSGEDNFGMILRSSSLVEGVNLVVLKGSDYPVESERPRLKIVYTTRENQ
jgi:hypothetical protein